MRVQFHKKWPKYRLSIQKTTPRYLDYAAKVIIKCSLCTISWQTLQYKNYYSNQLILSLTGHVQNICKGYYVQLYNFRWIKHDLSENRAILIVNGLVSSCLDCCNSLFRSLSSCKFAKTAGCTEYPRKNCHLAYQII